jgi:hypothetical protein
MVRLQVFHLRDNLLRFVGQGVDFVIHQLGENPSIIILWYTLHQVVAVLALWHHTSRTLYMELDVIHRPLDLLCVLLYILTIA